MVNGTAIPLAAWERELARVTNYLVREEGVDPTSAEGEQALARAEAALLSEMIDGVLLRQAAEEQGITVDSEQLEALVQQDIKLAGGEEAFDEWLQENGLEHSGYLERVELQLLASALRDRVTATVAATQPQVHLRHILLATREEAETVLHELEEGAAFEGIAAARSVDPGSRERGGDLGWVPAGILPEPVEAEAWQLSPGERSEVIESEFGFHIIELIERAPERALPRELLQLLQQQAWEQWLEEQREAATIERHLPHE
jgi:parvulin-like peptidyl-prolyl isomerase